MTSVQERQANVSNIERARQLLAAATQASIVFEESVRELVSMRAWELLGYENFSEMWKEENGFECPTHAKVLAVEALSNEGLNTRQGRPFAAHGPNGHTNVDIAKSVGLPVHIHNQNIANGTAARLRAPVVQGMLTQLAHGVPADKVQSAPHATVKKVIDRHGTKPYEPIKRARPKARRIGTGQDELVHEAFCIIRRDADAVAEIARKADVSKSEIYRQAVAEYLARQGASSRHGAAPNGAIPMPSFSNPTV